MSDLDLIRDLGETLDPTGPAPHDRMRARVVTGLTAGRRPVTSRRRARRHPVGRPLVWGVPLAAAATVAALLVTGTLPGGMPGSARPGLGSGQSEQVSRAALEAGEVAADLDARTILLAAADQARSEAWTAPAADRFVYRRWTGVGWESKQDDKGKILEEGIMHWANETWISVDGTRHGLRFHAQDGFYADEESQRQGTCPGPRIANVEKQGFEGPDEYCAGPGAVTDVPTDAAGALAYLRRPKAWDLWTPFLDGRPGSAGQRGNDADVVFNAWILLRDHLVPPQSRAAIFQALATLPGFEVVPDVTTSTGRKATAVVFTDRSADDGSVSRSEYLFDPSDHEVIGYRTVLTDPARGIRNRVDTSMTLVDAAVVTTAGTRPDGSEAPAPTDR